MWHVMQLEGPVAHTGPDTFIIRVHFYLGNGGDKNDYSAVRRARRAPPGCRRGVLVPRQPRRAIHNGHVCRHGPPPCLPLLSSTSTCCKSFKLTVLWFMGPLSFNNRNKSLVISCWIFTHSLPKVFWGSPVLSLPAVICIFFTIFYMVPFFLSKSINLFKNTLQINAIYMTLLW